jgi:cytochrome b
MQKILVWDLPTRLFHWLLAAAFAVAWLTAESDTWLAVHVFAGYLMLGLVAFRLAWGVIGSRYARFSSFLFGPKEALAYLGDTLQGKGKRHIGHNPAGSWAIYGLLALTLAIGLTGLLTLGGEENHGPFAGMISHGIGHALKELHEGLASAMLALVGLHLVGVAVESLLHRENLAKAMVTGRKKGEPEQAASSPRRFSALVLLALVLAGGVWHFKGYATETPRQPYLPFVGQALPSNKTWQAECGGCHLAFHPSLLPARSWQRMMAEQDRHFGETLGLDAATSREILAFLENNAADRGLTEAAYKINRSLPAGETPLRITDTPYWRKKHRDISEAVWRNPKVASKANCTACHLDAEQGTFEDGAMRLPGKAGS